MSSLSRRACYKCGNVGHYAEVCSSAERLCYNCMTPTCQLLLRHSH
ncbi:zinc finger protein GIS2 [Verticillium alfalfae VaMs.102]|uniref:Zinc finger protein GIS2 n=1 Tax=Verticillium alfalfae (strain VaMs.102 / ATCC MYA-4576 / FGSC 10136) TaxID=526221 RepID=C9SGX5_VERA1|nr:zinc finger protein GIS2 [Verticillium alfalfae VaMs.102]EEY18195.1 zinc finger protein GIS2 [Verticillium alfalfae VaMs.102]